MTYDEFVVTHCLQSHREGWLLTLEGDRLRIVAGGDTLKKRPSEAIYDLDATYVAGVAVQAVFGGSPCHVEALKLHGSHFYGLPRHQQLASYVNAVPFVRAGEVLSAKLSEVSFNPIAEGRFPKNTWVLLRDYRSPPRFVVARYDEGYRPLQPWVDADGDSVLDAGPMPTHWSLID